jgi:hypothetical protein
MPLAAVLDQEREQPADALEVDGIDDAPLVAARAQKAGAPELREGEDMVEAGTPKRSAIWPAGNPSGPSRTSSRNTRSRCSWARPANASIAVRSSIFPI